MSELVSVLASSRLVTLSGPGGSGKTRLALRAADAVLGSFPDGVWLAELAGVADPSLVASRVALAVKASTTAPDAADAVADALRPGSQLLVLDNCEHVIDAAAHLTDGLLRACPGLVILATSREPLRVTGEAVWRVGPLDDGDATALFRARAPFGVRLTDDDDALVAAICRRLDGIPLAIELAAAQLGSLELPEIADGVDTALGMLTGGVRTNPRQETMHAAIDWSYRLLADDDRSALNRLSVFAGGFTASAADEVCGVRSELGRLTDASLATSDGARFRVLETVRRFAAEHLSADDHGTVASRLADWISALVRRPDGMTEASWLDRLAEEHDNIEAALGFAVVETPAVAARIARAAVPYWIRRGYWVGGRQWVERVLQADDRGGDGVAIAAPVRAELLKRAGDMARVQGDPATARERLEAAVALDRATGDPVTTAASLNSLGLVFHALGDLASARAAFEESIELCRRAGEQEVLARALNNLGMVHETAGEIAEAIALFEQTATIMRERRMGELGVILINLGSMLHVSGDLGGARRHLTDADEMFAAHDNAHGRSYALCALAKLDLDEGDAASARRNVEECLEIVRRLGDEDSLTEALHVLGRVEEQDGNRVAARRLHAEALDHSRERGASLGVARALSLLGALDVDDEDFASAAHRFGEAHALREAAGATTTAEDHVERAIERARSELGPEAFERAWRTGRANATPRRP